MQSNQTRRRIIRPVQPKKPNERFETIVQEEIERELIRIEKGQALTYEILLKFNTAAAKQEIEPLPTSEIDWDRIYKRANARYWEEKRRNEIIRRII